MRNFKDLFFILFSSLFLINKILEMNGISIPFIHAYMDDFICLPIILTLVLFIFRRLIYGSEEYCFPLFYIVSAVVIFSIGFEVLLPSISGRYTKDFWDILAYTLGGIFFNYRFNTRTKLEVVP